MMSLLVEYINPPGAAPAQGLYSHVARCVPENLYFIAGQLAVGSDGEIVGAGNFEASSSRCSRTFTSRLTHSA